MLQRIPFFGGVDYIAAENEAQLSRAYYPTEETEMSAQNNGQFYIEYDEFHIWD
jgi:hypothetical protein